jgi:hypothetical protein
MRQGAAVEASAASGAVASVALKRFTTERMIDLMRAGLATATAERVVAGRNTIEVARVRITEAGRRASQGGNPAISRSATRVARPARAVHDGGTWPNPLIARP